MPSAADFKRAFGLTNGSEVGKFAVASSHVGHEVKQENERYEFPTEVSLEWRSGTSGAGKRGEKQAAKLKRAFRQHTRLTRIVYSPYGSPYECSCSAPRVRKENADGQRFTVTCRGTAVRRRDVPTLGQQKAEERKQQGVPQDVSPEDKERYLKGYRLIKSRFGSGKCGICEGAIDQGERIAKLQRDTTRGGWSHATCLVQQLKQGGGEGEEAEKDQAEEQQEAGPEESSRSEEEEEEEEEEESQAPRAASGGKRKRQPAGRAKQQPRSKRTRKPSTKGKPARVATRQSRRTRARAARE